MVYYNIYNVAGSSQTIRSEADYLRGIVLCDLVNIYV